MPLPARFSMTREIEGVCAIARQTPNLCRPGEKRSPCAVEQDNGLFFSPLIELIKYVRSEGHVMLLLAETDALGGLIVEGYDHLDTSALTFSRIDF